MIGKISLKDVSVQCSKVTAAKKRLSLSPSVNSAINLQVQKRKLNELAAKVRVEFRLIEKS